MRRALAAGLALALGGCELGTTAVAPPRSRVVVHAVLDARQSEQSILVERSLTGTVDFGPPGQRAVHGIPVRGARVSITRDDGVTWRAMAQTSGGEYIVNTGAGSVPLAAGRRYRLEVRTPEGEVVTGETTIPAFDRPLAGELRVFDRDRDTLQLAWPAVRGARSYAVRAYSPFGAFTLFVDSLSLRLPGSVRNLFADDLPRLFLPGFRQTVLVTAIDANYFDYYRSGSDPFTGSGLISHLEGGIGVFGAIANLYAEELDVVAAVDEPGEGSYVLRQGFGPDSLRLWIETPATAGRPAFLTGRYFVGSGSTGILGTRSGGQVGLALLAGRGDGRDTAAVFTGELRGDTLAGVFRGQSSGTSYLRVPR